MKSQLCGHSSSTVRGVTISKGLLRITRHHWQLCFATTALIFLILVGCKNNATEMTGEVNVIDVRKTKEPEINLAKHMPLDVEVYRINFLDSSCYSVIYYQNEKDTIKSHKAYYVTNDDFDKAVYKWTNDTTVAIKLLNSLSKNQLVFKVFGYGRSSGIILE
jgi:hypothetical protein